MITKLTKLKLKFRSRWRSNFVVTVLGPVREHQGSPRSSMAQNPFYKSIANFARWIVGTRPEPGPGGCP